MNFDPDWAEIIVPALYDVKEELHPRIQKAMDNKNDDLSIYNLALDYEFDLVHELQQEHIQDNIPF